MGLRELAELPAWVWSLLDALDRWENEHPTLYEMDGDAKYVRTECGRDRWRPEIPNEAMDALCIYRAAKGNPE